MGMESAQLVLVRCLGEESNHWHRRLLRVRGERPSERRTTEKRDELAPPHIGSPKLRRQHCIGSNGSGHRSFIQLRCRQ
jgi:hypothetical protein